MQLKQLKQLKKGDKFRFEGDEKVFTVEHVTSTNLQYGDSKDAIALSLINPPDVLFKEVELVNELCQNPEIPLKRQEFSDLVNPLLDWLAENYNPHTTIIITRNNAELVEGVMSIASTPDYLMY